LDAWLTGAARFGGRYRNRRMWQADFARILILIRIKVITLKADLREKHKKIT
jgi:hypothetical protein